MRVFARQIWWLQVMRITIGCVTIAVGIGVPWLAVHPGTHQLEWRAFRVLLPGGILIAILGAVFAAYARLEWRPRGFAAGVTRHGLILKANGFRCPKLVAIKWEQIRSAQYLPPRRFSIRSGRVKILLHECLPKGTLPTERGEVVELGPYTIGLKGPWDDWHPEDVANLISSAANDPAVRASL